MVCPVQVFGPDMQKKFPCVTRYFVTLAHQPQFKAVVGDMALATDEQKYVRASRPAFDAARIFAAWKHDHRIANTMPTKSHRHNKPVITP